MTSTNKYINTGDFYPRNILENRRGCYDERFWLEKV